MSRCTSSVYFLKYILDFRLNLLFSIQVCVQTTGYNRLIQSNSIYTAFLLTVVVYTDRPTCSPTLCVCVFVTLSCAVVLVWLGQKVVRDGSFPLKWFEFWIDANVIWQRSDQDTAAISQSGEKHMRLLAWIETVCFRRVVQSPDFFPYYFLPFCSAVLCCFEAVSAVALAKRIWAICHRGGCWGVWLWRARCWKTLCAVCKIVQAFKLFSLLLVHLFYFAWEFSLPNKWISWLMMWPFVLLWLDRLQQLGHPSVFWVALCAFTAAASLWFVFG